MCVLDRTQQKTRGLCWPACSLFSAVSSSQGLPIFFVFCGPSAPSLQLTETNRVSLDCLFYDHSLETPLYTINRGHVILYRGKAHRWALWFPRVHLVDFSSIENTSSLFHNVQYFWTIVSNNLTSFFFLETSSGRNKSNSNYLGVSNESINIKDWLCIYRKCLVAWVVTN